MPRDTATVVISYNGINPGGTITATISNATIGRNYEVDNWGRTGGSTFATATSSTLILTITGVGGNPGESFFVPVYNRDTGEPIGAATFDVGVASNGRAFPSGINVTWDGVNQLVITYDNTIATNGSNIWTGGNWGGTSPDYSVPGTITISNPLVGAPYGDSYDIEVPGSDHSWYHDIAAFWIYPGDTTVYTSSGTLSGNLVANFSGAPTSGVYPLTVAFTNQSRPGSGGAITDNLWNFGDGTISHDQNPIHIYTSPGTYTVSLTVTSPDGSDTKTRTNYITVRAPSTNIDCAHAITLDPNGGTMVINNSDAPNTPAAEDQFNLAWPYGPEYTNTYYDYNINQWVTAPSQFSRQIWYKVTNTSNEKLFLRFVMKNWTGILVSALYFGPCGGLTFAADSWYNNHFVPSFNIDSPNNSTSTTFFPSYGYCGNGSFWDTSGGAGPYGTCLGVVVDPGQTVFIELAGDDFDTWGSYPAAPNHGWNGDLTITWDFHTVSFYDGIDSVVPPGSEAAAIIPGDDGLSETIPPHTALDWSGFDLTEYVSGSPPDTDFPRAYYHFNGHHFIAGLVTTYFSSAGYTSTDGTFDSGADEYMEQLGIWELDESGTQVGFWVIFVGKHTGSLSLINAPAGEGANDRGRGSRFCSDGANLWFVTPLYEVVLNPYGGQFDERAGWKYTWAPTHAAVFSFSGGGWTKIGAVDAATSNTIFFNSLVGGYGSNGYVFDATASPDEPGVLHVVTSEWGTQDGPDGVHTGIFQHGTSGTSPRQIRWQTTYAQFSSSAKTLQVPLDEYNAAAGSEADASIGSHSSNPSFCWIRNDGGTPIFMRIKGIDQFGTPSLTDTFEVYDVSGGTSSLIQTIHAADMMPARPSFWDINHFSNPDQIKQGVLSDNSQFDVGNDNQRVWLLNLFVQDSTHLANNAKFSALIRIPVNNPTIYYWFENDPTKSDFGLGLFPFSFFCELKQTWIVPANFANIYQYIRCTNYSLGLPSWQFNKLSYSTNHAFSNEWYPEFNLSDYFHDIFMKDDNFYYTSRYIENQGVGDGLYHSALVKTHILRNWYICSIDTNVVSIPAAALIRIYPNGNVKYITGDFKIIRISPDGKVHHQDATVGNAAILTISPNGDVRLKN